MAGMEGLYGSRLEKEKAYEVALGITPKPSKPSAVAIWEDKDTITQELCYNSFFSFFSYNAHLLTRFLSFHTVPPERPPPKCSFSFTCCAWSSCPIPTYLLWMSFYLHALPQCSLVLPIAQPSFPLISILALVL